MNFPLFALSLLPSPVLANAGTPLMWAAFFHLALGNALIGLFEGLLLSFFYKGTKLRSILVLIAGNYASAWVGGYIVSSLASIPDITIVNLRLWFIMSVVVTFLFTLIIEFPFFWIALRPKEGALRQSVWATPLVHAISYPLLFGWYWMASGTSMITELRVVPPEALFPDAPRYSVYYLSPEGDRALRLQLGTNKEPEVISSLSAPVDNDRLFVRKGAGGAFDLFVIYFRDQSKRQAKLIRASFAETAALDHRITHSEEPMGTWDNFGPVATLASESVWEFNTGFWPVPGIWGRNKETNQQIGFSIDTPFINWNARNATLIEGDRLVFQLGPDQICILHPESRRIALLVRGKGPVVAIAKEDDEGEKPQ